MQLIASKILPPLPPALLKRYASPEHPEQHSINIHAKYCPTMDLIATYPVSVDAASSSRNKGKEFGANYHDVEDDDDDEPAMVDVWRLNGQLVFSIPIKPEGDDETGVDIMGIDWRDDGQMIAILGSDNMIRLVNSFSGRVVHRYSSLSVYPAPHSPASSFATANKSKGSTTGAPQVQPLSVTALAYSTLFSEPLSVRTRLETATADNGTVLDDLLSLNADIGRLLRSQADLPGELASIDMEASLPKLACLPPPGFGIEDVFSARSSVDAMFHAPHRTLKSGSIDVLCVGRTNGMAHLRIFDSFEIGDVNLTTAIGLPKGTVLDRTQHMISHPFGNGIFILVGGIRKQKPQSLHIVHLDLKFIAQAPSALSVLATKATQLHSLLRYLQQIQTQLMREIKTAFELPGRFLRPLNEDLAAQQGEGSTFTTSAYHTLVTGDVDGVFKEWLSDVLGDRGVKRWEKAVGDCLELVRRLISEGWMPAVERAGVVISRLAGLAGCNAHGVGESLGLGVDRRLVEALRTTIEVMTVCGEDLLRVVNQELSGFASFIRWLKWEVEVAALEATSERLDEMRESSDHADISRTLKYIENDPAVSPIKAYVGDAASPRSPLEDELNFYINFRQQRKKAGDRFIPPSLSALLSRMQGQCEKMFEQIATTLSQAVMITHVAELPMKADQPRLLDARLVPQPEYGPLQLQILRADESTEHITCLLIQTNLGNHKTSQGTVKSVLLTPPGSVEIYDAKFIDEKSFLVMAKGEEQHVTIHSHPLLSIEDEPSTWQLRHTFSHGLMESGMMAYRLEVNGRKNRRAVAVMDHAGKGYVVFDLDSSEIDDGDATMTD